MQNGVAHLMNQYTSSHAISVSRFWSKVNKDGSIPLHMPHLGQCWEWTAGLTRDRYGNAYLLIEPGTPRLHTRAHRVSWILTNGNIPDGLQVLHKCDNRICVNPAHLFLGTNKDNVNDRMLKGRHVIVSLKGEKNPHCTIPDATVIEIMERYNKGGVRQVDLAKEYGISSAQISVIARGLRKLSTD